MLQDTHIHIQDIKAAPAIEQFIVAAESGGLGRFFNCAITPADWPVIRALADKHQSVVPFFGFHPWFGDMADEAAFDRLETFLAAPDAFAGEMGLDKTRKNIDYEHQKKVFGRQLDLAAKYRKPYAVHCVRAWEDTITLIRSRAPGLRFLIHSFNGSVEIAHELSGMGAYFSVSAKEFLRPDAPLREAFVSLPAERILVETDFPYQVKWSDPEAYMAAINSAYGNAAAWRNMPAEDFINLVYNNGTLFTHGTLDR